MFAVIADGSRQIRVQQGDVVRVDYRDGLEKGGKVTFDRVLLANGGGKSAVGAPAIANATVAGEVVIAVDKGEKLEIQKYKKRKNYRRHTGHRQKYTQVKITAINVPNLEIVEKQPEGATPAE
jgi:large subunit ribosomal protein L21